MNTFK